MVVRSILVDQQIGPEVFVMICGVLQKDASVHRGHFWFEGMPFAASAVPPENGPDDDDDSSN